MTQDPCAVDFSAAESVSVQHLVQIEFVLISDFLQFCCLVQGKIAPALHRRPA